MITASSLFGYDTRLAHLYLGCLSYSSLQIFSSSVRLDEECRCTAIFRSIGCSNHEPMNQSCTVSTEAVCPSRKTTLCSSPCTIKSTSDKFPSKVLKTIKQPRKVLKIAHINICSLRNKVHEVNNLLVTDDFHILTISETHLDNTFDTVVVIHGYNIY